MPETRFPHLPGDPDGTRLCGVEIELGGLAAEEVTDLCVSELGGRKRVSSEGFEVTGSVIGDLEVYLDTALRKAQKGALRDIGLELGKDVIPVEIVTEPLDPADLARLDSFRETLRRHGAIGSGGGILLGFGVHLNVQTASDSDADIVRPLLAYALIEDHLRHAAPIDSSRRLLPFTDPYPTSVVKGLIDLGPNAVLLEVIRFYLSETPTRNRGLDMLPIFADRHPDEVENAVGSATSPRPAFHFRLPDCRIDEAGWSLKDEWARWRLVEEVAANAGLLQALCDGWTDCHGPITLTRAPWAERCAEILKAHGTGAVAA